MVEIKLEIEPYSTPKLKPKMRSKEKRQKEVLLEGEILEPESSGFL